MPTDARKPRQRYQHKVCSLKVCRRKGALGCMHCTCDGSCKTGHQHGQCGDMREGSGSQCTVRDCSRDGNCTHSRRAVCYNCRRHRASRGSRRSEIKGVPMGKDRSRLREKLLWQQEFRLTTWKQQNRLPGIHLLGSIHYNEDARSLKQVWINCT